VSIAETVLSTLFERLIRAGIIVTADWATLRFFEEVPFYLVVALLVISGFAFIALERKEFLHKRQMYSATLVGLVLIYLVICGYAYIEMPAAPMTHSSGEGQPSTPPATPQASVTSSAVAPAPQPPKPKLSAEEIATKIGVWASIDQQMNDLSIILNKGNAILNNWLSDAMSDRGNETRNIEALGKSVQNVRTKLDQLRGLYTDDPDIAAALKPVALPPGRPLPPLSIFLSLTGSIDGFAQQLASFSDPLPQSFESEMIPYVGAFRRDLNAMREWQSQTKHTAAEKDKELSKMESK